MTKEQALDDLEKEFYKAITEHSFDPNYMDGETQRGAKAAASLCREKMKEAWDEGSTAQYQAMQRGEDAYLNAPINPYKL